MFMHFTLFYIHLQCENTHFIRILFLFTMCNWTWPTSPIKFCKYDIDHSYFDACLYRYCHLGPMVICFDKVYTLPLAPLATIQRLAYCEFFLAYCILWLWRVIRSLALFLQCTYMSFCIIALSCFYKAPDEWIPYSLISISHFVLTLRTKKMCILNQSIRLEMN